MKYFIAFAFCVAVTIAAPQNPADVQATIVHEVNEIDPQGNYHHEFETSNGIKESAVGTLKQNTFAKSAEDPQVILTASGEYSFLASDGQTYTVKWIADENGYQPQGAHLPVA